MRRKSWRPVLDAEVRRWSALPWERLEVVLREGQVYEVDHEEKKYQVEVELLENTPEYLNVIVSVDDGRLPQSIFPLSKSFVKTKDQGGESREEGSK